MREVVAVLHNIRSIYNVGSIFRTADGAGVGKIYLCGITPSPVDRFGKFIPQFSKVSLGAEKHLGWEKIKSTVAVLLLWGVKGGENNISLGCGPAPTTRVESKTSAEF